jgi:hypothetical protein
MLQWNTLVSGHPVTFEMRWKKVTTDKVTGKTVQGIQWILATCVPVFDNQRRLISIVGNTVDISVCNPSM